MCTRFSQDCTYFPMCNICATYAQDCTYFPNVQHMHKICARLYLFPNAQYMRKIVLLSPMCNTCARFAQDCTSFPIYAQNCTYFPMCNIALYFILSRDVPILKSFSAGRPKICVCCSGGCSVAVVAELSWPIVSCQNGRRKQRIAYRTFLFQYQYQRQTIEVTTWPSIYSQFKGHTQRFFCVQ